MAEDLDRRSASALDEDDDELLGDQYLTFRIGAEDFAIEVSSVVEIVGIQHITQVPDMPPFMRGVINLRGGVIPVVDVRRRFGLEDRAYDTRTCIVVVNLAGITTGLIVDTVSEVLSIPADLVSPPPSIQGHRRSRFVRGVGRIADGIKLLLDLDKLLLESEQESMSAIQDALAQDGAPPSETAC
jgi:purine-binding chemotaxis protein CheW